MRDIISGRALKYGSDINTDIISPPQYMELSIEEAVPYTMSAIDPLFYQRVKANSIFVAEENLGSGSSRETAPLMLKHAGVKVVIAQYFARIFYRNLINSGVLAIECNEADQVKENDELEIQIANGVILNLTQGKKYSFISIPTHIKEIIKAGGLYEYLKGQRI